MTGPAAGYEDTGGRDYGNERRVDRELAELRAEVALLRQHVEQLAAYTGIYLLPAPAEKADPDVIVIPLQGPTK